MSGHCDFCQVWHSGSCCHPGRTIGEWKSPAPTVVEWLKTIGPADCATLLHAAELLEREAKYMNAANTYEFPRKRDDFLATAKALREIAQEPRT